MTRVVVTGASGMLGGAIFRNLLLRDVVVRGWSFSTRMTPNGFTFRSFDLDVGLERELRDWRPELVVHCAALTDADLCERRSEHARRINSLVPGRIASCCSEFGARLVHVSTDAVYDGVKPGRRKEDESPGPTSVYAKTKLEGEERVLTAYPDALVVRTTMFGWTLPGKRPKFAEEVLAALTNRTPIRLWGDAFFSPLHVDQLAEAILDLAAMDVSGVLNVGARDPVSKADFGRNLAATFGLDPSLVEETSVDHARLVAPRPKNVGLNVSTFAKLWGRPPTVESGIRRLCEEASNGTAKKIRGRETYP